MTSPNTIGVAVKTLVGELSIVDEGAVMRRFLCTKSKENKMPIEKLLEDVLSVECEGEEAIAASATSDNEKLAKVAIYRVAKSFSDVLGNEGAAELFQAAGFELPVVEVEKSAEEPQEEEAPAIKLEDLPEEFQLHLKAQEQRVEALEAKAKEAEAKAAELQEQKLVAEFAQKAASFENLDVDKAELASLLKDVSANEELGVRFEKVLKALNEQRGSANLYSEVATGRDVPEVEGSADAIYNKMKELAVEAVAKGRAKTQFDAMSIVKRENKELYAKYRDLVNQKGD